MPGDGYIPPPAKVLTKASVNMFARVAAKATGRDAPTVSQVAEARRAISEPKTVRTTLGSAKALLASAGTPMASFRQEEELDAAVERTLEENVRIITRPSATSPSATSNRSLDAYLSLRKRSQ